MFYFDYQKQIENESQFIDNINEFKKNDSIIDKLNIFGNIISKYDVGIKYLGSEIISNQLEIFNIMKQDNNDIEESYLHLVNMRFEITHDDITDKYDLKLFIPKLINDNKYFKIRGVYYNSILQVIDKNIYSIKNGFILKTLKMPMIIKNTNKFKIASIDDVEFEGNNIVLKAFSTELNPYSIIISKFSVDEIFNRIGVKNYKLFIDEKVIKKEDLNNYHTFKISNNYFISFHKSEFKDNIKQNKILLFLNSVIGKRLSAQKIDDITVHLKRLGSSVTNASNIDKGLKILKSFESFYDEITMMTLEDELNGREIKDSYDLIEFLIDNYDKYSKIENLNMNNKRIRLYEYLLYNLQDKFTDGINRIVNNRKNTINTKRSIFSNISPNYIIRMFSTNLNSYNNIPNGNFDIFNSAKFSFKGPQSLAANNDSNISDYYRSIHDSYLGVIELIDNSNSDPGMTGTLLNTIEINKLGLFINKEK